MSNKDVTRLLQQPGKRYVGARLQQGRSLLDSDFNEGAGLAEESRRGALLDLIGPQGTPDQGFGLGQALPVGFTVSQTAALRERETLPVRTVFLNGVPVNAHMVSLRAGALYVGGMRFALGEAEPFVFQRGFLQMRTSDVPVLERERSPSPFSPRSPRSPDFPEFRNFYYLNAWEQTVTAVEDEELLERALGGPDTTVRVARLRRAEVLGNLDDRFDTCEAAWAELIRRLEADNGELDRTTYELRSKGRLQLVFEAPAPSPCPPCTPDPPPRYLGPENQALRIMLTRADRFVWSFDDAAPLYRVRVTGLGARSSGPVTVQMLTPPRDDDHQPRKNRVVEILPFGALLEGGAGERPGDPHFQKVAAEVGAFSRVLDDYDPSERSFTLDPGVGGDDLRALVHTWDPSHPAAAQLNIGSDDERFFFMRLWHEAPDASDVELSASGDPQGAALGDTGVIPVFHSQGRRGDTWLCTLRTDTRLRVVPFDLLSAPGGVPPHGPRHFYAPLALLHGDNVVVDSVSDCRRPMRKVTDRGCATVTVGDRDSIGDFPTIQSAVNALPAEGGVVSLRPGTYEERISIQGRSGITIEGCGEASIVMTPRGVAGDALVRIEDSENIALSSLTLHVGAHVGVLALGTTGLSVEDLDLVAGQTSSDGTFTAGAGAIDSPLIDVSESTLFSAHGLTAASAARAAVRVQASSDVRLERCTSIGVPVGETPSLPMVGLTKCERVRLRELTLDAQGQVGVSLVNVNGAELAALNLAAKAVVGDGVVATEAAVAIDLDGCSRVHLRDSQIGMSSDISEEAAVAILGTQITVEGNRVEAFGTDGRPATARAWGGIHVRGKSSAIDIHRNHIVGGLGHGITLGSVLWQGSSDSERRAVGSSQINTVDPEAPVVTGDLTRDLEDESGFFAFDEGPVEDIGIVDNRIESMSTNGISVITVLGLGDHLIDVRRAVIAGNDIVGNVGRPSASMTTRSDLALRAGAVPVSGTWQAPLAIPLLPFGGIVLGTVTGGVDVRGNVVSGNSTSPTAPVCGVFVLNGDAIRIADNRIVDNGAVAGQGPLAKGVRAGIAVLLAGTGLAPIATGSPIDTVTELNGVFGREADVAASGLDGGEVALQVLGNTVKQLEGRALHAVATAPVIIDANFFCSTGYHGFDAVTSDPVTRAEQFAVGDVVFVENLGRPWETTPPPNPIPSNAAQPPNLAAYLANQLTSPRQFTGLGGSVLFNNNQVLYSWDVKSPPLTGNPLSFFAAIVLSLDHVTLARNHFSLRLSQESSFTPTPPFTTPLLADAFVGAATLEAMHNRLAEVVGKTAFSLITSAELMNITVLNQSTHPVLANTNQNGDTTYLIARDNQVLFQPETVPSGVDLRQFFGILFQPSAPPPVVT
jgi:hypothetical protein